MRGFASATGQFRMLLRQLSRSPRRALLTFLGLVVAFFLFTALESVLYTLEGLLSQSASETGIFMRPRSRASFFRAELPIRYVDQVRAMQGVVEASPARFHFGAGSREGSFVAVVGVEPAPYLRVRPIDGVSETEAQAFRADRRGALVGEQLLASNGWQVGDEVTVRGRGRSPDLSLRIRGDIAEGDRMGRAVIAHLDYLAQVVGGRGRAAFIQARVAHPSLALAIARGLDARFANFSVPTRTRSERSHAAGILANLSDVLVGLRAIGYLALAVTVLVVGNAVAMGVRERTVEIGTLRALGFGRGRVMGLVLGEAVLLALLGGVVGALGAYALFESGWLQVPRMRDFTLRSDISVVVRAALLALPVGALAGVLPAFTAVRRPITESLRWAD